jgi:hypothetical protein
MYGHTERSRRMTRLNVQKVYSSRSSTPLRVTKRLFANQYETYTIK